MSGFTDDNGFDCVRTGSIYERGGDDISPPVLIGSDLLVLMKEEVAIMSTSMLILLELVETILKEYASLYPLMMTLIREAFLFTSG